MKNPQAPARNIRAPISIGELIDKLSILEIKAARIVDPGKRSNVQAELRVLQEITRAAGLDAAEMKPFAKQLKEINSELWDLENEIRKLEARKDFGEHFIALARKVYLTNDRRARVKHEINLAFASDIIEEKSYGD